MARFALNFIESVACLKHAKRVRPGDKHRQSLE